MCPPLHSLLFSHVSLLVRDILFVLHHINALLSEKSCTMFLSLIICLFTSLSNGFVVFAMKMSLNRQFL